MNKTIKVEDLANMPIENVIELYRQGYRLEQLGHSCDYKENIYNTGTVICQDDGNLYKCQSDGTWGALGMSCGTYYLVGMVIAIPLFILSSIVTYKIGKWGAKKLGLEK